MIRQILVVDQYGSRGAKYCTFASSHEQIIQQRNMYDKGLKWPSKMKLSNLFTHADLSQIFDLMSLYKYILAVFFQEMLNFLPGNN